MSKTKYTIQPSNKKDKKLDLVIETADKKKVISFGAKGYDDFTLTKDADQKQRYIKRHSKESKNWTNTKGNLEKPSYLALKVLWNQPSIDKSIKDIEKKQNIKIIRKK